MHPSQKLPPTGSGRLPVRLLLLLRVSLNLASEVESLRRLFLVDQGTSRSPAVGRGVPLPRSFLPRGRSRTGPGELDWIDSGDKRLDGGKDHGVGGVESS